MAAVVCASLLVAGCGSVSLPAASSHTAAARGTSQAGKLTRQQVAGTVPTAGSCHFRKAADGKLLPDPACTPGATDTRVTQGDIASTICKAGYTAEVRPVVQETDHGKYLLMRAYGTHAKNELDHLVPLELGGSSNLQNLWPEPGPIPNAKDKVETELRDMACAGVWYGKPYLPLAVAQRLIRTNWTTAVAKARMDLVSNR